MTFSAAADRAISNLVAHGDTDIFPYPFENHIAHDAPEQLKEILVDINNDFDSQFGMYPPSYIKTLAPVGYTGFRWASQIDPIWNLYFLSLVISIGDTIEPARVPTTDEVVFSYRFDTDTKSPSIFLSDHGWRQFMQRSLRLADEFKFVVTCDISEFYARLNHHRLDSALQQISKLENVRQRIKTILSNFSNSNSYGLPIGGPAARLLSEITLDQIDKLLLGQNIKFVRFSDDFHMFANSYEEAYSGLLFLSEKLLINQGLSLQKSKTRIQTSSEFKNTTPNSLIAQAEVADVAELSPSEKILQLSIKFDPYSPTAEEDYEQLKSDLSQFDIIGLLKSELTKSRVHVSVASKLVQAIRYIGDKHKDSAAITLIDNTEVLYPILPAVFITLRQIFDDLSDSAQLTISSKVRDIISSGSHSMRVDLHLAYAVMLLAKRQSPESESLLQQVYAGSTSPLVRRYIILALAKWNAHYWLSDLKNTFSSLGPWERRAFIVASFSMTEEARHWREHTKKVFTPFENVVAKWAADRKSGKTVFEVPI